MRHEEGLVDGFWQGGDGVGVVGEDGGDAVASGGEEGVPVHARFVAVEVGEVLGRERVLEDVVGQSVAVIGARKDHVGAEDAGGLCCGGADSIGRQGKGVRVSREAGTRQRAGEEEGRGLRWQGEGQGFRLGKAEGEEGCGRIAKGVEGLQGALQVWAGAGDENHGLHTSGICGFGTVCRP